MHELNVDISQILDGFIREQNKGHYECMIRIVLEQDDAKELCRKKLLCIKEQDTVLFCGVIQITTIPSSVFGSWEAIINACSVGILMDRKLNTHTYQNKSPKEIVEAICGEYGGDSMIESSIETLPKSNYLQDNETDWDFLRRLLSVHSSELGADWLSAKPKLYIDPAYNPSKSSNGIGSHLNRMKHRMAPLYFRNRCIYRSEVSKNGSKSVIRSGISETLFEASDASYDSDEFAVPAGWKIVDSDDFFFSGFCAITLLRNNSVIVAYAGSSDLGDWAYNLNLDSKQYNYAMSYILRTVRRFPKHDLYLTGHSLGGHLALEAGLLLAQRNQSAQIKRIEIFNGLGASSPNATERNIGLLKDKTISNEYRLDVVSEISRHFGKTVLFDDGKYDAVKKQELTQNDYVAISAWAVGYSIKNHFIDMFRSHFLYNPSKGTNSGSGVMRPRNITLKGQVIETSGEGFRVSFPLDRIKTDKQDAFLFQKATSYVGVYMMPQIGDTVVIEFRQSMLMEKGAFESAVCVRIERSGKK